MHYHVQARLRPETAGAFLRKLNDGTIETQRPDGEEIVASMQRARVAPDGIVRWDETCYCASPLQHERETVYDHHFVDLQTCEAEGEISSSGEPFMEYLKRAAGNETP